MAAGSRPMCSEPAQTGGGRAQVAPQRGRRVGLVRDQQIAIAIMSTLITRRAACRLAVGGHRSPGAGCREAVGSLHSTKASSPSKKTSQMSLRKRSSLSAWASSSSRPVEEPASLAPNETEWESLLVGVSRNGDGAPGEAGFAGDEVGHGNGALGRLRRETVFLDFPTLAFNSREIQACMRPGGGGTGGPRTERDGRFHGLQGASPLKIGCGQDGSCRNREARRSMRFSLTRTSHREEADVVQPGAKKGRTDG